MDSSDDIDLIVDQLRMDAVPKSLSTKQPQTEIEKLNDENVSEYVYKKTAEIIELGLGAVNSLKDAVTVGQDPKEISALAQLIGATTKAIDNLNKINLQAKQHKNNLEVAKVEATSTAKQLQNTPQTNNIVIATRDEIVTKLLEGGSRKEKLSIVDTEYTKE
jgi:DNA integrity scanning protein DisA with diadenylate cyclase activity